MTRSETSHEFTGLRAGRTYYLCVYVESDYEVVSSRSIEVSIPPRERIPDEVDAEDSGGGIPGLAIVGLIVAIVLVILLTAHRRMRKVGG